MLKSKDVTQASTLDLHGAFVRRTDLSGASLRGAVKGFAIEVLEAPDMDTALSSRLRLLYIDREKLHLSTMEK